MTSHTGFCPAGGKRCYASRGAAKRAMAKAHNKIRIYFCKRCMQYHVTSEVAFVPGSRPPGRER